jgi:hypothetical protein
MKKKFVFVKKLIQKQVKMAEIAPIMNLNLGKILYQCQTVIQTNLFVIQDCKNYLYYKHGLEFRNLKKPHIVKSTMFI